MAFPPMLFTLTTIMPLALYRPDLLSYYTYYDPTKPPFYRLPNESLTAINSAIVQHKH